MLIWIFGSGKRFHCISWIGAIKVDFLHSNEEMMTLRIFNGFMRKAPQHGLRWQQHNNAQNNAQKKSSFNHHSYFGSTRYLFLLLFFQGIIEISLKNRKKNCLWKSTEHSLALFIMMRWSGPFGQWQMRATTPVS